ncbi:MAG: zinc-dependent metalloprotease, partial [Flavitalea sp.]
AQTPILNSYPAAQATIFLDFDGEYVTGSSWNWSGPIDAQPAVLSPAQITEVFNRVSEDYGIFNLNITTDPAVFLAAPLFNRMRIIVTSTSSWYGPAGGVSFVGSFTWGNDTPGWVFSSLLGNNVKKIAEAISHETGHTLGLQHQSLFDGSCAKTNEYSPGQGTGEIGWAPIMGVGYSKNLTTWHNGTSTLGCTAFQNDINVIAGSTNNFGLRTDDHLDSHTGASPINIGMASSASGIINNSSDRDVFKFELYNSNNFQLSAIPQNVGTANEGANVDIKVALLDGLTDTIGRYNPADLLNVGIDTNLNAGIYYLVVDGVDNANLADYGSLGFYTLSASLLYALPVHRLSLSGRIHSDEHALRWNYFADEKVKEIYIESSRDGIHFNFLSKLNADARNFNWKPLDSDATHYRVKVVIAADERAYYSNIILLRKSPSGKSIDVINRVITDNININVEKNFNYQLFDETGRLLQKGTLQNGSNQIGTGRLKKGILFLKLQHNDEVYTERFMKR